jgi:hypothetical protein
LDGGDKNQYFTLQRKDNQMSQLRCDAGVLGCVGVANAGCGATLCDTCQEEVRSESVETEDRTRELNFDADSSRNRDFDTGTTYAKHRDSEPVRSARYSVNNSPRARKLHSRKVG